MEENLRMDLSMEKAVKNMEMVINMKEIISMVYVKEPEGINGQMEASTMVTLSKVVEVASVSGNQIK